MDRGTTSPLQPQLLSPCGSSYASEIYIVSLAGLCAVVIVIQCCLDIELCIMCPLKRVRSGATEGALRHGLLTFLECRFLYFQYRSRRAAQARLWARFT